MGNHQHHRHWARARYGCFGCFHHKRPYRAPRPYPLCLKACTELCGLSSADAGDRLARRHRFSEKIRTVDHWVAMLLLAAIGIKMILDTVKENAKSGGAQAVPSYGGEVGMRTLVVLAIATSIDALAVGVSFSCADVNRVSHPAARCRRDWGHHLPTMFSRRLYRPPVWCGIPWQGGRDRRHPAHWDGSENFCGAMYRRLKLYPSGISAIKPQYGQLSNDVPLCRKQAD